jgi:hypothetical protein
MRKLSNHKWEDQGAEVYSTKKETPEFTRCSKMEQHQVDQKTGTGRGSDKALKKFVPKMERGHVENSFPRGRKFLGAI